METHVPLSADQRTVALFEIERMQEIVARHEGYTFKIRGWLYTVLAALTAALYTQAVNLAPLAYFLLAFMTIVLFLAWELVQRAPKRCAINRVREIEIQLRADTGYDGPKIADSFVQRNYHPLAEAMIVLVWLPYVLSIIVVVLLALAKHFDIIHPMAGK